MTCLELEHLNKEVKQEKMQKAEFAAEFAILFAFVWFYGNFVLVLSLIKLTNPSVLYFYSE